jgi:probable F420-dependent oxidoreductase
MRFGLALPHYDFSLPEPRAVSFQDALDAVLLAERLGFHSAWVSDHFFLSLERYGGGPERNGSLEPMTTLAALAVRTERIRLGTLVLGPFRHPAILAKSAAAVDLVSGGRFDLGIGAGWYEDEFRAFGYRFGTVGDRFALLEESLEVLKLLFAEGPAHYRGRFFRLDGAYNHPAPAQRPGPPVWLGAKGGPRSLRLAVRLADGWNTVWRWTPQDYAARLEEARRICEREGRDPATLRLSVGLYTLVGEDDRDLDRRYRALQEWGPSPAAGPLEEFARGALVGTPDRVLETVAEFEALGVEEIVISPASLPFALPDPTTVEVFAEAVLAPASAW